MSGGKSFSALMRPEHLKTVRAVGYVLTLGDQNAWLGVVPVLVARLTVEERAALAFVALKALDHDDAALVAETALWRGAGLPQAPFGSFLDQAAFWAGMAEPEELEAYCLASFKSMAPTRRAAFLDHVQGARVA